MSVGKTNCKNARAEAGRLQRGLRGWSRPAMVAYTGLGQGEDNRTICGSIVRRLKPLEKTSFLGLVGAGAPSNGLPKDPTVPGYRAG